MRFDNVMIESVEYILGPHRVTSSDLEEQISGTLARLGIRPGMDNTLHADGHSSLSRMDGKARQGPAEGSEEHPRPREAEPEGEKATSTEATLLPCRK